MERSFREYVNPVSGMVTETHFNSWTDEMIVHTYQPWKVIEAILEQNKARQNMQQYGSGRMRLVADVPIEINDMWEQEFARGKHTFANWDKFLTAKLNSREFSFFKTIPGGV